jgi:hypothetical protein
MEDDPIICDVTALPDLCGHADYCRKVALRIPGWHHCNGGCPQLPLPFRHTRLAMHGLRLIEALAPQVSRYSMATQEDPFSKLKAALYWRRVGILERLYTPEFYRESDFPELTNDEFMALNLAIEMRII